MLLLLLAGGGFDGTRLLNDYDGASRLTQTITVLTQTVAKQVGAPSTFIVESFAYDADSRVTSRTDDNGRSHTFTYDPRGRLHEHTDPNGNTLEYE